MKYLNTIQKHNNLNQVRAIDEPNHGAHHVYHIGNDKFNQEIRFQNGARGYKNSKPGVLDTDLLEVVRDRLTSFENSTFQSIENHYALTAVETALLWLNKRTEDRAHRDVLGYDEA